MSPICEKGWGWGRVGMVLQRLTSALDTVESGWSCREMTGT